MKIRLKKFKVVKSTNDIAIKLIKKNIKSQLLLLLENKLRAEVKLEKNGFHKQAIYLLLYFSE